MIKRFYMRVWDALPVIKTSKSVAPCHSKSVAPCQLKFTSCLLPRTSPRGFLLGGSDPPKPAPLHPDPTRPAGLSDANASATPRQRLRERHVVLRTASLVPEEVGRATGERPVASW